MNKDIKISIAEYERLITKKDDEIEKLVSKIKSLQMLNAGLTKQIKEILTKPDNKNE